MNYEPELGQMVFGQPYKELQCPEHVEKALKVLAYLWDIVSFTKNNPFYNTGERYDGAVFSVHAYSWAEEEYQQWNFKWKDIEVSWYKYLGRGMSINRKVSKEEIHLMLGQCIAVLMEKKLQ